MASPTLTLIALAWATGASAQSILSTRESPADRRYRIFWASIGRDQGAVFREAARLRLTEPIDDLHASLLSRAYFQTHFGACGGADRPVDRGPYWSCKTAWGYDATPGPEIRIDKRTGAAYVPGGRKVFPQSYRVTLQKMGHGR